MICDLCGRDVEKITRHHLKPKSRGGAKGDVIMLCLSCKDQVHLLFSNKELEREYNTLEKLLATTKVQKYLTFIRKQKKERITMKKKKRRIA